MSVIVAGAGEVGAHVAEVLSAAGHGVTVIDLSAERLRALNDRLDVRTLVGSCAHLAVLNEAGCAKCQLFVAATDVDEINLLAASLAKTTGAGQAVARVHHTANFSLRSTEHIERLGIDQLLCPEHLTSLAIARAIRNPGSIVLEEFSQGQLLMQRFSVSAGTPAEGKKLAEVKLPASARVATVESNGVAAIADAGTLIAQGAHVTVIGETKTFDAARKVFNKNKPKRRNIAVMGETSTAVWLCRALKNRLFTVRVYVENHARAEEMAAKLDHVTIVEADPTDAATFADEHIEMSDVFIAVTNDDEHNILGCAQAKALGAKTAIAVVQRKKYLHLFGHVGIDYPFSPRDVAAKAILSLIDTSAVRSVAQFADGVAEVYDIKPSKRAKILGHELRNIKLPPKAMIAAIRRGDHVYVPGAEDQVLADDKLLAIGPAGIADDLRKLFVTK